MSNRYCPTCDSTVESFLPGPGGRENAVCPNCHGLERHRFLALLLQQLGTRLSEASAVLDIAPMETMQRLFREHVGDRYISIDISTRWKPVVQADLTRLPFADGSMDLIVAYHILEHIPDDARAISELARVMTTHGLILIQVPLRRGVPTEEDLEAPPEVLQEKFGQYDHVRLYGDDFEEQLFRNGLIVAHVEPQDLLSADEMADMGMKPNERVWFGLKKQALQPVPPL